jgi:hypothetical protein
VLYPKYLLGGMMQSGGGIGAAERGEADGLGGSLRNIAGRWPDADALLQSGMSEGLRDWDLWGPLIFCLLLSLFLSWGAGGQQRDLVFSGVFALVWVGEAVVTMQIKLLGGNMYVSTLYHLVSILTATAPSSSPSQSSATRCSHWSSRQPLALSASPSSSEYRSTLSSLPGRWQPASASWEGRVW